MDSRNILLDSKIDVNYSPEKLEENILQASRRNILWFEPGDYAKGRELMIVGGGPSLKDYLEEIREKQARGAWIMSLNGAYEYLQENEIISDCMMMLDARPVNTKFVKNPNGKTLFMIASQCHPDIFEALKEKVVVLWHSDAQQFPNQKVQKIAELKGLRGAQAVAGGQTVGARALILAFLMGFRKMYLYGFDSSYTDGHHHPYEQKQNDTEATIELEVGSKKYITTPLFARQVYTIQQQRNVLKRQGAEIILRSDGFIKGADDEIERLKTEMSSEIDKEVLKYSRMWSSNEYRQVAPGEGCVDDAIKSLDLMTQHRIVDFGCGTGRGAKKFIEKGFKVIGVDFAQNCLDSDVKIPLCIACLWDLPPNLTCDYGFCTDVMEHIPTDKVEMVLMNIAKACHKGCYFQISLVDDDFGALIDDKLHMTVKPSDWWLDILKKYFTIKSYKEESNCLIVAAKAIKTIH